MNDVSSYLMDEFAKTQPGMAECWLMDNLSRYLKMEKEPREWRSEGDVIVGNFPASIRVPGAPELNKNWMFVEYYLSRSGALKFDFSKQGHVRRIFSDDGCRDEVRMIDTHSVTCGARTEIRIPIEMIDSGRLLLLVAKVAQRTIAASVRPASKSNAVDSLANKTLVVQIA